MSSTSSYYLDKKPSPPAAAPSFPKGDWLDHLTAFDRCAAYGPRVGLTRLERLNRALELQLGQLTPELIHLIQTHWTSGVPQELSIKKNS